MKSKNKKEYSKENYLANGHKTQNQWAKNHINTSIEEPGINESGIEAKNAASKYLLSYLTKI